MCSPIDSVSSITDRHFNTCFTRLIRNLLLGKDAARWFDVASVSWVISEEKYCNKGKMLLTKIVVVLKLRLAGFNSYKDQMRADIDESSLFLTHWHARTLTREHKPDTQRDKRCLRNGLKWEAEYYYIYNLLK